MRRCGVLCLLGLSARVGIVLVRRAQLRLLGWVYARARAMSGWTAVRNEWAGRRWGTPKEFGIAAPYAGQRKGHNIGLGLGLGHGRANEEAGLGTFGGSLYCGGREACSKQIV